MLAEQFKNVTSLDALVLSDPDDYHNGFSASWFQTLSERDIYVSAKVPPYTDAGIKEWLDRQNNLKNWNNFLDIDFYKKIMRSKDL